MSAGLSLSHLRVVCPQTLFSKKEIASLDQKGYLYDLLVHDLRGPLSVIATTANGLLCKADRYGPVTESQEHCLKRIARNTRRAQLVLEEILDVARSEEHLFQAEPILFESVVKQSLANALERRTQARPRGSSRQTTGKPSGKSWKRSVLLSRSPAMPVDTFGSSFLLFRGPRAFFVSALRFAVAIAARPLL